MRCRTGQELWRWSGVELAVIGRLPALPHAGQTGEIVMSQIIGFLENLGRSPTCGRAPQADYAAIVASLQATPEQRQALLARDHAALSGLLGGRAQMMCLIWQPSDEPEHKQDDGGEGQREPEPPPSPDEEEPEHH